MAHQKVSVGKDSNPEKSDEVYMGPRLEPVHPSITHRHYDPHKGGNQNTSLMGFVLLKGNTVSQNPWVKILCPSINTTFYSTGKHILKLSKGGMVSFKQAARVCINGDYLHGATAIKHLTREQVLKDNEGDLGSSRFQTWAQGTIRGINGKLFQPRHAVEFLESNRGGRAQRLMYETATLVEGSQSLPPNTPVYFQAALKKEINKNKKQEQGDKNVEVISVVYDHSRYAQHAGSLMSSSMLGKVEGTVGKAHILMGSSSLIHPCGISILDLVQGDDTPIEGASLDSLIKRALVILEERHDELLNSISQNDQENNKGADTELIARTLAAHKAGKPLHVFASPNFITRKRWLNITNRHYSHSGESQVAIGKVRIMEMASSSLNEDNAERILGLQARHVDEWRTTQHHESLQLFRNAGPFVVLKPNSPLALLEMNCPEHTSYQTINTNEHIRNQLLVTTLSPHTPSLPHIECTIVDLDGEDRPDPCPLDPEMRPSLLVVYWIWREDRARAIMSKLQENMDIDFIETVPHPDARKVALRLFMAGADEDYLEEAVQLINNPDAEKVLHAGRWDKLYQDCDDDQVRTLLCKAGFNPAHELLAHLDPDIQYVAITQGIIRIKSKLSTEALLLGMQEFNADELKLRKSSRPPRGNEAIFQAIRDGGGLHWAGMPASPPMSRNINAWSGKGFNGPPIAIKSRHRILIKGPAPSWTNKNLERVLEDYGLSQEARSAARWTSIKGEIGTCIEVAHASVADMVADAKTYNKFLVTELQPLGANTHTLPNRLVLLKGEPPKRNPHAIKVVMLDAIKHNTTGKHLPDTTQAPLIALTKKGGEKPATERALPHTKTSANQQAKSGSHKKGAGARPPSKTQGRQGSNKKATSRQKPGSPLGSRPGSSPSSKQGSAKKAQKGSQSSRPSPWVSMPSSSSNPKPTEQVLHLETTNAFIHLQNSDNESNDNDNTDRVNSPEKKARLRKKRNRQKKRKGKGAQEEEGYEDKELGEGEQEGSGNVEEESKGVVSGSGGEGVVERKELEANGGSAGEGTGKEGEVEREGGALPEYRGNRGSGVAGNRGQGKGRGGRGRKTDTGGNKGRGKGRAGAGTGGGGALVGSTLLGKEGASRGEGKEREEERKGETEREKASKELSRFERKLLLAKAHKKELRSQEKELGKMGKARDDLKNKFMSLRESDPNFKSIGKELDKLTKELESESPLAKRLSGLDSSIARYKGRIGSLCEALAREADEETAAEDSNGNAFTLLMKQQRKSARIANMAMAAPKAQDSQKKKPKAKKKDTDATTKEGAIGEEAKESAPDCGYIVQQSDCTPEPAPGPRREAQPGIEEAFSPPVYDTLHQIDFPNFRAIVINDEESAEKADEEEAAKTPAALGQNQTHEDVSNRIASLPAPPPGLDASLRRKKKADQATIAEILGSPTTPSASATSGKDTARAPPSFRGPKNLNVELEKVGNSLYTPTTHKPNQTNESDNNEETGEGEPSSL